MPTPVYPIPQVNNKSAPNQDKNIVQVFCNEFHAFSEVFLFFRGVVRISWGFCRVLHGDGQTELFVGWGLLGPL
jgi:hypothetical protein